MTNRSEKILGRILEGDVKYTAAERAELEDLQPKLHAAQGKDEREYARLRARKEAIMAAARKRAEKSEAAPESMDDLKAKLAELEGKLKALGTTKGDKYQYLQDEIEKVHDKMNALKGKSEAAPRLKVGDRVKEKEWAGQFKKGATLHVVHLKDGKVGVNSEPKHDVKSTLYGEHGDFEKVD
jgi:DNA repair exonuclease SbcCD ATPase subunit